MRMAAAADSPEFVPDNRCSRHVVETDSTGGGEEVW